METIRQALQNGNTKKALQLLEEGADINEQGEDNTTALMVAIQINDPEIITILLSHKADVNKTTTNGTSALHMAILYKMPDVVVKLLEHGADIHHETEDGMSPLIAGIFAEDVDIIRILLAWKANPLVTKSGVIPLQVASDEKNSSKTHKAIYELLQSAVPHLSKKRLPHDPVFKAIHDKVGFEQHIGECWVDTIQEIFFFADKIKEITQPLFYTMTDAQLEIYLDKAIIGDIFPESEKEEYRLGFNAMRERFINHYNFLRYDEEIVSCTLDAPLAVRRLYHTMLNSNAVNKKKKSAEFGVLIGKVFQSETRKKARVNSIYNPGETGDYSIIALTRFFTIFNIPFMVKNAKLTISLNLPIYAITVLLYGLMFRDSVLTSAKSTHATGFLYCNNTWYYYDNINGLVPVLTSYINAILGLFSKDQIKHRSLAIAVVNDKFYLVSMKNIQTYIDVYYKTNIYPINKPTHMVIDLLYSSNTWNIYDLFKKGQSVTVQKELDALEEHLNKTFYIIGDIQCVVDDESASSVANSGSMTKKKRRSSKNSISGSK
jgi:hypothetical protein